MDFKNFFSKIKEQLITKDTGNIPGKLAIQVNLTGESAGTFYIEVINGTLSIEPYDYEDRDVAITLSSENFLKLIQGKADPVMLFTLGKLKVDGDVGKALELKKFI